MEFCKHAEKHYLKLHNKFPSVKIFHLLTSKYKFGQKNKTY